MTEEDADRFHIHRVALARDRVGRCEVGLRRADDSRLAVRLWSRMLAGEPRRLLTAVVDLSDIKRSEAALAESVALFEEVTNRIQDVFFVLELPAARVIYVSPAFSRIWGRSLEEVSLSPRAWLEWVHPEDRERLALGWRQLLEGTPFRDEYRIVRPDGSVRVIRARTFGTRSATGTWRLTGIAQDVTEERILEEELRHSHNMEAMGTLASSLAHDFNNLLMGVGSCATAALERLDPSHPAFRFIEAASAAMERSAGLTAKLLALARRKESARLEPVIPDALIASMLEMLERVVGEHVRVEMTLGAAGARIFADPIELEQVLMNLAVNARDAMPRGGTLAIRTSPHALDDGSAVPLNLAAGEYVLISIRDTGVGMDEATRIRAFEPFFTTKAPGKGTGLGLSSVFAIIKRFGGHIRIETAPGRGTEFQILLPARDEPLAVSEREIPGEGVAGKGTVLVVEDDELVRLAVGRFLERLGYESLLASGATEALALAAEHAQRIDVLLTDVTMPDRLGPDLARELRASREDLRVVYMSANPLDEQVALGRLEPGAPFLHKPFESHTLGRMLRRLLAQPTEPAIAPRTLLVVDDNRAALLAMKSGADSAAQIAMSTLLDQLNNTDAVGFVRPSPCSVEYP